jgi:hypothetical protein
MTDEERLTRLEDALAATITYLAAQHGALGPQTRGDAEAASQLMREFSTAYRGER